MPIDDESGEFIEPKKTYLDDVEIFDEELGGVIPAWKSLIYHGVKAKHLAQHRADSAAAISEEAQKGAPSSEPKRAPPLVADAVEASQMERIHQAIADLEARLDRFEQRRRDEAAQQARIKAVLDLAEELAETDPAKLNALLPDPRPGLN
jgi:hypothetical protein